MGLDTLHTAVLMLQGSGSSVWQPKSRISMAISRLHQLQCQWCGTPFTSVSPAAKWCHVNCRQYAYRARLRKAAAAKAFNVVRAFKSSPATQQALQLNCTPPGGVEARIWQHTAIQRRQDDGYAHATVMCLANGKHLPHYLANDRTTEYITALAASLNLSPAQLVISTTTGPNHLRGTWIHPRLAVDLARWISPAFAVWMDGWFLESMQRPTQPLALAPTLAEGVHVVASDPRHANWLWMQAVENQLRVALMTQYPPTKGACWTGPAQQQQPFQLHLIAA